MAGAAPPGRASSQGRAWARQFHQRTGHGQHVVRARRPAYSTIHEVSAEEREGRNTVGSPVIGRCSGLADTAVSIEREVVSGHAYAILAPRAGSSGRCGYDTPTYLSVNGVSDPTTLGPGADQHRGPQPGGDMGQPDDMFGDENYPAYTMGRAAEIIGATPDFLRRLDETKLISPHRSAGGHRRYSRHQLRLAARARELVDQGTALEAACRIIDLEDQLEEARHQNEHHANP